MLSRTRLICTALAFGLSTPLLAEKETYTIDTQGSHASINFKIKHLGYSWLLGEFKKFDGTFAFDPDNPSDASVNVTVNTGSLDSNHSLRDKHVKGPEFLDAGTYPETTFISTRVDLKDGDAATIFGNLTLRGVTKEIAIDAKLVGRGKDPWGGYRAGFEGTTTLKLADFGIPGNLGPQSTHVEMSLFLEGVRQ